MNGTIRALSLATGLVATACAGGTPATPSPEPTPAATASAAPTEPAEASGPATPATASLTGFLLLPDAASLPPGSSVVVRILDQSSPDADVVLAEQTIAASEAGPSPIGFSVEYDPSTIVAER